MKSIKLWKDTNMNVLGNGAGLTITKNKSNGQFHICMWAFLFVSFFFSLSSALFIYLFIHLNFYFLMFWGFKIILSYLCRFLPFKG